MSRRKALARHYCLIALALTGLIGTRAQADTLASSTFDSDLGGWTSNTPAEIAWQSSGGNPGGFVEFTDETGASTYIYAPSQFLGDYISSGVSSISFDDDIFAETGVESVQQYEIDLSGPGGSAIFLGSQPSSSYPTGWISVTASISDSTPPAGWTVTSGTWLGLLGDVSSLGIPIELVSNVTIPGDTDIEGIDNVVLSESATTPEPASLFLAATVFLTFAGLRWRRMKSLASIEA